jgi:hypothetical protein
VAGLIALLHDVGRFEQYKQYHTFNDSLSVDHAGFGVEVLKKLGILNSHPERNLIYDAIYYHNKRHLPVGANDDFLQAKIIRDADKLDIFEMIVTDDEKMKIVPSPEFVSSLDYSQKIVDDILANKLAVFEDIKTAVDQMLFRLSWVYNIYFPYSCQYILKKQYLEKIFVYLPQTAGIAKVHQQLRKYLEAADEQYQPALI